jgi:hypothetical protein
MQHQSQGEVGLRQNKRKMAQNSIDPDSTLDKSEVFVRRYVYFLLISHKMADKKGGHRHKDSPTSSTYT